MSDLIAVLRFEMWGFLIALIGLVFYQMVTGKINMRGLLYTKEGGPKEISPARIQALLFSVSGAFYYFFLVLGNPNQKDFPEVPTELLLVLAGSHTIFLGGKLLPLLREKLRSFMNGS
jgi:hypothetical protein